MTNEEHAGRTTRHNHTRNRALTCLLLGLTLILAACNPTKTTPPVTQIVLLITNPAGTDTINAGESVTIDWSVTHASSVLVTSDNDTLTIPGSTDFTGSYTTTLHHTTTFTVTANGSTSQSVTVNVLPTNNDEDPDPGTPDPVEGNQLLKVTSIILTNGGPPATVTITGEHLPTDFTSLTGNYEWSVYEDHGPVIGWSQYEYDATPNLTKQFQINQSGTFHVHLTHPDRPNLDPFTVTFTIPKGAYDLTVTPFEPAATSTTITINHNADWQLHIPEWLTTTDALTGTGNATITVTLPEDTEPGAFNGEVTLTTTTPGLYYPTVVKPIHFTFARLSGTVEWDVHPSTTAITLATNSLPHPQ